MPGKSRRRRGVTVFKWRKEKGWENFVLGASKSLLFAGDE